jgi:hypothetical protein
MVSMTQEMKTSLLEVVDFAASKLQIDSKSKLFLAVQEAIERHTVPVDNDDWLEAAKPVLRIHRNLESCEACSA